MAITKNTFTGNGTTVLYSFSFPYLDESHVKATLNGTPTTAFTFANATTLQFNSAPGAGVEIVIFRETDSDQSEAVFAAGSPIRAADLNQNNTQLLYVAQENVQGTGEANATSNLALTNSNTAISTANAAVVTANAADAAAAAAVITANTAESNSLAAVSTANTASSNASAAVITANSAVSTANSAVSTANGAVVTANAASSTANQAAIDAAAAVVTANAADGKADAAVLTANAADANASAAVSTANSAVSTANSAVSTANSAVSTANTAESNSLSAISTANSAAAAVASAVIYQPVVDLTALALLTPNDGDFFELQDSTGADTDPSITGVPVGLVGAAGLTFRLRYDDPPGEYAFLGYFANDSETRYLKTGTGTVTSTNILDGTIVDADISATAAIAGTKISPNFGSQNLVTTGTATAASLNPTGSSVPTNGVYLPAANSVAISTNGTGRLFVDASGNVAVTSGTGSQLPSYQTGFNVFGGSNAVSATAPGVITLGPVSTTITANEIVGRVQFYSNDGSSGLTGVVGKIDCLAESNFVGTAPTALTFHTNNSVAGTLNERMRLDSSGRLGLGTSSPGYQLEVSSGANDATALFNSTSVNGSHIRFGRSGTVDGYLGCSEGFLTALTPGDIAIRSQGALGLATGGANTRLYISSTGNVGIGVTGPTATLHTETNSTGEIARFVNTNTTAGYGLYVKAGGSFSGRYSLKVDDASGVEHLKINQDGIVSIGNPATISARLNVKASSGAGPLLLENSSGGEVLRVDSSGRLLVGTSTARANLFNSSYSPRLQIESANSGSGSSIALVSAGNGQFNEANLCFAKSRGNALGDNTIVQSADDLGGITFQGSDGSEFVVAASVFAQVDGTPGANDMPGRLVFSTTADGASSPTERMRITNAGNVGIAVTAPTSLLHLRGTGDVLRLDTSGSEDQNGVSLRFHQRDTTIVDNQGYGGLEWEGSDSSNAGVRGYIKGFAEGATGEFGIRFATQGSGASSPVEQARLTSTGDLQFNSGYGSVATAYGCRAWVNFDGTTATPSTIRGSGNVSSITKNGTGDYTVNFTAAMVDVNYCATACTSQRSDVSANTSTGYRTTSSNANPPTTYTTTQVRFVNATSGGTNVDSQVFSVSVFR